MRMLLWGGKLARWPRCLDMWERGPTGGWCPRPRPLSSLHDTTPPSNMATSSLRAMPSHLTYMWWPSILYTNPTNQNARCPHSITYGRVCKLYVIPPRMLFLRRSEYGRQRYGDSGMRKPCGNKLRSFGWPMVSDGKWSSIKRMGRCCWLACHAIQNQNVEILKKRM